MTTKLFNTSDIKDGYEIIPTVIVTIVNYWDGQKSIKRAYMNYIILGLNYSQENAYDYIVRNHPSLFNSAEKYALENSDIIYHQ